jgi:hypothetical protein
MGALGGPPEEIGHKVAAALVGTFPGILLCYGFVSDCSEHGQVHGQGARVLSRDPRGDCGVHQRIAAQRGGGVRASRDPRHGAAKIPGTRRLHQKSRWSGRRRGTGGTSRPGRAEIFDAVASSDHHHKKKAGHGEHHGGDWKVAYADFVTAMMALFIMLWLMNSSNQVKEAVGGYFKDPTGNSKMVGSDMRGSGDNFIVSKDHMNQLKEELQKSFREVRKFDKLQSHIDMTVTNEGLRIELTESATGAFFESGSAKMSGDGNDLLKTLAQELGKLPNHVAIEGHTDSKPILVPPHAQTGSSPPIAPMQRGD